MRMRHEAGSSRMVRRSTLLQMGASGFASIAIVRSPAQAAQFVYKLGHPNPVNVPQAVRTVQMANAIKAETNGRLEIQIFPSSQLGSSTSMISQLRLGTIQFLQLALANASGIAPVGGIESVGYAFRNEKQFYDAMDGQLGAYVRGEFALKGIYVFERAFDLGARQVTSSTHPIRNVADFAGFRLRTLTAPIVIDFFRTLGASPVPLDSNELYTSLQSHLIDGCDFPVGNILDYRVYEVQKYISITNHLIQPIWLSANVDAWNALPPDIQAVVTRNAAKFALMERDDMRVTNGAIVNKLQRFGLAFNTADTTAMRARLGPYYARCKSTLGAAAWDHLETAVGKLG